MQSKTMLVSAMLLASMLVLSSIASVSGIFVPAFAKKQEPVTMGQHVPNDKELTINTIELSVKKKTTHTDGTITVQVVQDENVLGSAVLKTDDMKKKYKTVTVEFENPVKVSNGTFDIVVLYMKSEVAIQKQGNKIPGNAFVGDNEKPKFDLKLTINGAIPGKEDISGEDNEENNPPPTTNNPPPQTTNNVKLTLVAKNANDKSPIPGMQFSVWKDLTKVAEGYTPNSVEVPAGQTYMIVPTAGYQTMTFDQWEDTKSTTLQRSELINNDKTLTVLYTVETTNTPPPNETNTPGDPDPQPTPTGGPNTVTVSSQLLDGSSVPGLEAQLREASTGNNVDSGFTTATLDLESGKTYRTIMYSYSPYWFRHWTDGGLHRYHLVTGDGKAHLLTSVFEKIPTTQEAKLWVAAKTTDGTPIGGTTGTQEDNTLQAEAGVEVQVAPPGTLTPYTAGFTGGSEASPFHLVKGQTYTIIMEDYGKYRFLHWEDNDSTNRARAVPLTSTSQTLTAIYEVLP